MKVKDVMQAEVVTVTPDTTLKEAAALLVERGISGMPVVDGDELVGVLSEADLLVKESATAGGRAGGLLAWVFESGTDAAVDKLTAHTAGEAMTSPAITIGPLRPLHEAARRMIESGVNRLPVVHEGRLVGIVTRADLVRAFTRSDAEIADEIRGEVMRRVLWLAPGSVDVAVSGGEVTLRGTVENETDLMLLPVFVERIPGVVSVRSELVSSS